MKKVFFSLLVASVVMVSFQSCKDDDPKVKPANEISGVIETENSLEGTFVHMSGGETEELFGKGKVVGKKFKVTLNKPSDNNLEKLDIADREGMTISDKEARTISVEDIVVMKDGSAVGGLICADVNPYVEPTEGTTKNINIILFIYSDRPVKISGTNKQGNEEESLNLNLKTGWNIVKLYRERGRSESDIMRMSSISSIPSNYKWYLK